MAFIHEGKIFLRAIHTDRSVSLQISIIERKPMIINYYLVLAISILGILMIASVGISWMFANHFGAPTRKRWKKMPDKFNLDYEEVNFFSQSFQLKGWFIPARDQITPSPTVVIAHGWSSNMGQMLPIADFLHQAGFAAFLYDARSHGASPEDNPITLEKFAQDMIAAIDYLEGRMDVDVDRIGAFGHSMGGSGAILAASIEPRIQALVSSSAFADPVALTKEYMQMYHIPRGPIFHLVRYFINRWLTTSMEDIAPMNRISQISVPVLLLHAKVDKKVSPENLEILRSEARSENLEFHLIQGDINHSTIIHDAGFREYIVAFFKSQLLTLI